MLYKQIKNGVLLSVGKSSLSQNNYARQIEFTSQNTMSHVEFVTGTRPIQLSRAGNC